MLQRSLKFFSPTTYLTSGNQYKENKPKYLKSYIKNVYCNEKYGLKKFKVPIIV